MNAITGLDKYGQRRRRFCGMTRVLDVYVMRGKGYKHYGRFRCDGLQAWLLVGVAK